MTAYVHLLKPWWLATTSVEPETSQIFSNLSLQAERLLETSALFKQDSPGPAS